MTNLSYVSNFHQNNNKLFDLKDVEANLLFSAYANWKLKDCFFKMGYDLSTQDINPIFSSEAVIYGNMPKTLPRLKDISKSYLILFESDVIMAENWDLKKHKYFNKIFTWDDRLIDNKKYFKINYSYLIPPKINKDISSRKTLCVMVAGNKKSNHPLELYSKRIEAIRWFEKNKTEDFDLYGIGWDERKYSNKYVRSLAKRLNLIKLNKSIYPSYKGKIISKKEVLEKYKFSICYENARDIDGYITEKIFDCFFAGCIPVYWGANNINDHIPKNCFINKKEFDDYDSLYNHMKNMTDDIYLKYLSNIEKFLLSDKSKQFSAEHFAETIVENILKDNVDEF